MGELETSGYYALGVPFYLLLMATEMAVTRRRGLSVFRYADTIGNFSAGLGELIVGLFLGPLLIALYDFGYANLALIRWEEGSIVPWVIAFVVSDLCYYLYHRAGHRVGALWAIHGVHHQSEEFNVTIAMRHPWFSDSYSAIFYAPLPMLGVGPVQFFVAISIISFYALTVHSRTFHRPSLGIFVTPATHIVHHAHNPRYIGRNLGAMFIVWDKLFGTYATVDPADPPRLGVRSGYETHDGARAQWIFWRDLVRTARLGTTWRDRLRPFVSHPGWRPSGSTLPAEPAARSDGAIPDAVKAHVGVQFAATLGLALYVLWLRDQHPLWMLLASASLVLWSLSTLGRLLDGRRGAPGGEWARLSVALVCGLALAAHPVYQIAGVCLTLATVTGMVWLALARQTFRLDADPS